jgi:hypothetical protein
MRCGPGVPSLVGHVPLPLPFRGLAFITGQSSEYEARGEQRKAVFFLYLFTVRASGGMVQEGLRSGRTARDLRMRWRG